MAVTVDEQFASQFSSIGPYPTAELRYTMRGSNDAGEARTALDAVVSDTYDPWGTGVLFLLRESITVEPIGDKLWRGIARYGTLPRTNENTFAFDTGGGTQHITNSLQTMGSYAPVGKTAPNFQGAIGVTPDGVGGVDITVPIYHFSETHYLDDNTVDNAYKGTLFNLTGKVNNAAFKGFAAGECLFLGAAGTRRGIGDWEIAFRFAVSPNRTNLTIGSITGINKKGWEYLWVRYIDTEDTNANALVKTPAAVYIERVYEDGDFSALGIGT